MLVASAISMKVFSFEAGSRTMPYENAHLCSHLDGGRALAPADGSAFRFGFHLAPLPNSARQCLRAIPGSDRAPLGCTAMSVRNAIHAFHSDGLACLNEKSSRPHSARPLLDTAFDEPLRALLHLSPRTLGKSRSTWTLTLLAEVCFERGWTPRVLSLEAIRLAVRRLGISWRRAKHWITSPDPAYARKKLGWQT